jgi:aerobic-type carbon monoxide dehydrogenase small subunit (CoxS/CutS family)
MKLTLNVNGATHDVDVEPETPLLWVLRDAIGLTGTKYGCGIAECGACMIHLDGQPTKSCNLNVAAAAGKKILTIEGLSKDRSHPIQKAWIEHTVPQCGYCQSGQIMSAAALLAKNPKPSDRQIDEALAGNICRCGTYIQIREAIHAAAKSSAGGGEQDKARSLAPHLRHHRARSRRRPDAWFPCAGCASRQSVARRRLKGAGGRR